jgi:hypothetical protein
MINLRNFLIGGTLFGAVALFDSCDRYKDSRVLESYDGVTLDRDTVYETLSDYAEEDKANHPELDRLSKGQVTQLYKDLNGREVIPGQVKRPNWSF